MTPWERWSFNILHAVVAATGVAYFTMKYAMAAGDPFAVINHPWQPAMLAVHLVAAPVLIAVFGMLFRSHTIRKLLSSSQANRRTGWTSLISFAAMALSGYLLQVSADPTLRTVLIWTHIATSTLFVLGYGVHLVIGWRVASIPVGEPDDDLSRAARLPL